MDGSAERILREVARNGHANGHLGVPPQPLRAQSMADLEGRAVPPLRFIAGEWIPWGKPVLLSGRGGGGKTTLACQLGAARAVGLNFLGMPVEPGRTLALLCEEDAEDAHRMLVRLAEHFTTKLSEFADFLYLARAGHDNALVARTLKGEVEPTELYAQLAEMIGDIKPSLLILDNARHVARVNENDGAEVTAAWNLVHGLMRPTGGTTLLCGHTPKYGDAEFSGNAAWENVARCRLFLGPVKGDDKSEPVENDPRRIFRRGKANANGTASLDILWERGAFRLEHPSFGTYGEQLDRQPRAGAACQAFLDALDHLTKQRRHVSHATNAQNYAPKAMHKAGLASDCTIRELEAAMNTLFHEHRIVAAQPLWPGPDRHPVTGIARVIP